MRPKPLTEQERQQRMASLPGWTYSEKFLRKEFRFADFADAFAFMTRVAFEAEKLNHHPDWKNVYNKVDVALSTHDAGDITELDFRLANFMNKIYDGLR